MQPLASIPSPSQGVWHLGPIPLRAYAFMIILGIVVSVWVGERRWTARGGTSGTVVDIAVWAVPFGLVGGRLYHVITDNQLYFGSGQHWNPVGALEIWNGGLGIWGAIILGGVGAWIGCRRRGVNFRAFADALAPGIVLAQAIGRWGNYFNQELYGRPLHTFWALEIDPDHRPRLAGSDTLDPKYADVATYHPTFLYESIWCVGVALLVIWAGKKYKLNYGRSFALYVAAYTVGRGWIEALRIDNAHHFLGLRLNDYTAIIIFLGAVAYLYYYRDKGSVDEVLETAPAGAAPAAAAAEATPEPAIDEPAAEEPATEEPAAEESATEQPGTEQPEERVSGASVAGESATGEPVAEERATEEPVAGEPAAEKPVAEESVAEESVAGEPVAGDAVAGEPVVGEPLAEEPVAGEPVAEDAVAEESMAEEPEAEQAGAEESVAEGAEAPGAGESSDVPWWEKESEEPEASAAEAEGELAESEAVTEPQQAAGRAEEPADVPRDAVGQNGTRQGARVPEGGDKEQGAT